MNFVRDLPFLLIVAAITTLSLGPILGPGAAEADDAAVTLLPGPQSHVENGGVRFELKLVDAEFSVGDKPVMTVTLTNTSAEASAMVEARVRMMATPQASMMSRMISLPTERWAETIQADLKPGETQTLRLTATAALEAASQVAFELTSGKARTTAATLLMLAPTLKIAVAPRLKLLVKPIAMPAVAGEARILTPKAESK